MKIGIIGTRGIPNQYGGFEQFAQKFATRMAECGHSVAVYCSHNHLYKEDIYLGVQLIHCYDPEYKIGTAGQFVYDLNCIRDSRKRNFDIILQLGYTSSTVWSWLYPSGSILVTNMDGLEWQRAKYDKLTRRFLKMAERWGVKYSDHLIADSIGIQTYLKEKYGADAVFVPYGAEVYQPAEGDEKALETFGLAPGSYDLLIARFEPENSIETILKAYKDHKERELVLIGNYKATAFGRRMLTEYGSLEHIVFAGAVYDINTLNILRHYSELYLHGHRVGGTNPSLLEAMASGALICAQNNIFNKVVLGPDAFYFDSEKDLSELLRHPPSKSAHVSFLNHNIEKITETYNWDTITLQLESLFIQWLP